MTTMETEIIIATELYGRAMDAPFTKPYKYQTLAPTTGDRSNPLYEFVERWGPMEIWRETQRWAHEPWQTGYHVMGTAHGRRHYSCYWQSSEHQYDALSDARAAVAECMEAIAVYEAQGAPPIPEETDPVAAALVRISGGNIGLVADGLPGDFREFHESPDEQ